MTYAGDAHTASRCGTSHGVLEERPLATYVGISIVLSHAHRGPAWPQTKKQHELQPLRLLNDDVRNEMHNLSILGKTVVREPPLPRRLRKVRLKQEKGDRLPHTAPGPATSATKLFRRLLTRRMIATGQITET